MSNHVLTSAYRFSKYIFPLLNGLVFLVLFWLVASFIYRDAERLGYWSAGGFLLGILLGIAFEKLQQNTLALQNNFRKNLFLFGTLLVEFLLGLLLIGPFIWLQLRFIPVSNVHSICCETPKDYGAASFENVHLATVDGASIAGWYVPPSTQTGRVIILIHGYGYDRRGTDFQTRILLNAGYGVLLYDLRDHGESVGPLNSFNQMQVYQADLLEVVKFLRQKTEVQHIGVVGISLGAFATLNSSPDVLNSFSGLWMDGLRFENFGVSPPVTNLQTYLKHIFDQQTRWLATRYYHQAIPSPTHPFAQIIPTIKTPRLMLIASGKDESERSTNEKLKPFLDANKQLWIIENAWHIGGRFEVPDEYREKLLDFFEEAFNH